MAPAIEATHSIKANIARSYTDADAANEKLRVKIEDMPKKKITYESSTRYSHKPSDHGIF